MENIIKENFYKLKEDGYLKLYESIMSCEKNMYLDYRVATLGIRHFLERFINMVMEDDNISLQGENTLLNKITTVLKSDSKYKKIFAGNSEPRVVYVSHSGKKTSANKEVFLRWLGNASAHDTANNNYPKIDHTNISISLEICFDMLKAYFNWPKKVKYDKNKFYIGEYFVDHSIPGREVGRNEVEKECNGYEINNGKIQKYLLIDIYKKNTVKKELLIHSSDAYEAADSYSPYSINGVAKVVEMTQDIESKYTEYYIVAYEFKRKYTPIDEYLKKDLDKKTKVDICMKLAKSLHGLHNAKIYHRLLNHSCVYACEFGKTIEPIIAHLNFAKIDNEYSYLTVVKNLHSKKKSIVNENSCFQKYLSPELNNASNDDNTDYRKVDIYALGILFYCIFTNDFNSTGLNLNILEKSGISKDLIIEIDNMTNRFVNKREDDINNVLMFLELED